jgi:membrane protein implicated in regulation of membrane protease activity
MLDGGADMPQLIFFALIGLVAWFGYRMFLKEAARVTAKIRREEREAANGTMGTLVKDPETGEYRLVKD